MVVVIDNSTNIWISNFPHWYFPVVDPCGWPFHTPILNFFPYHFYQWHVYVELPPWKSWIPPLPFPPKVYVLYSWKRWYLCAPLNGVNRFNTKQILDINKFNIQFMGWRKVILDEVKVDPISVNSTILSHANCILDELQSIICYII